MNEVILFRDYCQHIPPQNQPTGMMCDKMQSQLLLALECVIEALKSDDEENRHDLMRVAGKAIKYLDERQDNE